jgi:glycosyltransferase involved in cell wall biosynthesis
VRLAIIVPVYNEAATIREVVRRLLAVPVDKEIIIVDDASTDGTAEVLAGIRAPGLKILRHPVNRGKGAAIRTAIGAVTSDAVVIQDADLEYMPEELPSLLKPVEDGRAQVVYGSRFRGRLENMQFANYLVNKLLALTASLLYRQRITDEATCYKLFRADLLKSLPLVCRRFEFCPEVTAKVRRRGIRILELPITYRGRTRKAGKKIRPIDAWEAMIVLLRYRLAPAV